MGGFLKNINFSNYKLYGVNKYGELYQNLDSIYNVKVKGYKLVLIK